MSDDAKSQWALFVSEWERSDGWIERGLLPVARLAATDPVVGGLFPFQSLNRLCFGRERKPEAAFPCVGVGRDGALFVEGRTYSWNDEPMTLTDVSSPEEALALVRRQFTAL